ncbi:MAG TPA: DUF6152 family protein [Bryobacteraceae bacterium]|jgi:hypothetical protein
MFQIIILIGLTAAALFGQGYETGRTVKLRGAVTRVDWVNPRAYFFINVKDSAGTVTNWALEIGNPLELERDGWKSSLVNIGDMLIVEGTPARGAARRALATSVVLERTGRKIFVAAAKISRPVSQPAPRWPDGHVRLGPAPGKKGYWGAASATALVETGVVVPMSREGLLVNLADADKVAPFQPWAKAVYEYRQRTLLKDDPYSRCLPPGGPRQFQTPNGFQFIEQPELGRVLVLLGGGDRNWRVIYMDGRPLGQGDDLVLTYYGTSVGHWEKDTLVVDSVGFNERFWMSANGLPHTEALHLTERFSRPELNTLKYEVTVSDPRTYTRPWSAGWTVQWVADQEIQEYFCEENAESTFVR